MPSSGAPRESRPAEPRDSSSALLARIPFHDPEKSAATFARLSATLREAVPSLLEDVPDPDAALNRIERLAADPTTSALLEKHPSLSHYALLVFGYSHFLGETLLQNSDLLRSFLRPQAFDRSFSREDFRESFARFRSRSLETDIAQLLSRFKRREYVRIFLRDVLKIAPLAETTAEISCLADVLIEEALSAADSQLRLRHGAPQHLDASGRLCGTPFAVLSLGKLGGGELNYSSDVDLLYIFGDGSEPATASLSNREYFVRLAQQVTDILSRATREGAIFRIDMRLRPQGAEGELAISLSQALRYYTSAAHDWELQALIKVRHSAGDAPLAREFIQNVQSLVYAGEVHNPPGSLESSGETIALECENTSPPASEGRLNFAAIETAM